MLTSLSQTFYIYDHLTLLCQLKYKAKANQAPPKLVPDSVSVCANHSCSMHPWVTLRWNSNFTSNSNQHSTPWKNTANCSMMNAGQRKQGNDCWRNSFNISSYIHKSSSCIHPAHTDQLKSPTRPKTVRVTKASITLSTHWTNDMVFFLIIL